jgi:hypothetical protein
VIFLTYKKCSQVIHGNVCGPVQERCRKALTYVYHKESVIIMPGLGIQLETHRGLPKRPLYASRTFIPQSSLRDLVINEGLQTWDVRYYLVATAGKPQDGTILSVVYPVRYMHISY